MMSAQVYGMSLHNNYISKLFNFVEFASSIVIYKTCGFHYLKLFNCFKR